MSAAKMLTEQGLLLEDIAAQRGFADYSGFYQTLQWEYVISPRQYRKVNGGESAKSPADCLKEFVRLCCGPGPSAV